MRCHTVFFFVVVVWDILHSQVGKNERKKTGIGTEGGRQRGGEGGGGRGGGECVREWRSLPFLNASTHTHALLLSAAVGNTAAAPATSISASWGIKKLGRKKSTINCYEDPNVAESTHTHAKEVPKKRCTMHLIVVYYIGSSKSSRTKLLLYFW